MSLMRTSRASRDSFQKKIFTWWTHHRRDLPWRRTRDPYRIMVSEVMLQQTQVLRVLPKYAEFIEAFPTVNALAQATPADVLRIWKGMGYNRRALYLHKAAKIIVEKFHNQLPISQQQLSKLPGLGTYTARAILVFAYKQEVPLIDTNIRQIITHFFFNDVPQKESVIEAVARQLIPSGKSWEWHQALMDYGAMELKNVNFKLKTFKKIAKPFRESNRYFRGRIIDGLRDGSAQQKELIEDFTRLYGKSVSFIGGVIASLIKDGLIERTSHGILRLPTNDSDSDSDSDTGIF